MEMDAGSHSLPALHQPANPSRRDRVAGRLPSEREDAVSCSGTRIFLWVVMDNTRIVVV